MPRRTAPQPASRRPVLRLLALLWGMALLLGHVLTWNDPLQPRGLSPDAIDALKHSFGILLFTVLYRASWAGPAHPGQASPTFYSLLVCSGWGALCESLQLLIPLRGFAWHELALNSLAPALVLGLWWVVEQVWD